MGAEPSAEADILGSEPNDGCEFVYLQSPLDFEMLDDQSLVGNLVWRLAHLSDLCGMMTC